nr:alpha-E domain-containing protein [Corynebacterium sp. UBA5992]
MLSRIAESMFWIGRYVGRADDQARVLTVNLELGTEADVVSFSTELCRAMGNPVESDSISEDAWAMLGIDEQSPYSMVTALSNCRGSARRAREILSMSTWEAINRSYRKATSGRLALMRPPLACREVRDSCSMIIGTLAATMPRDQAWHFLQLGRLIERMDMTARILYSTIVAPEFPAHHHIVLQACGAQQNFVMTRGREDTLSAAVDFILRDPLSPRSVLYCLNEALACLDDLVVDKPAREVEDEAIRQLGQLRARIQYAPLDENFTLLDHITVDIQEAGARATEALTANFFEATLSSQWHER